MKEFQDASMIVNMMDLVNKRLKIKLESKQNRWLLCYLFCILLFCYSCEKKNATKKQLVQNTVSELSTLTDNDSISIAVSFDGKNNTILGIVNEYLRYDELVFLNTENIDSLITKKIFRKYPVQILNYFGATFLDGKIKPYRHYYLIDKNVSDISFKFDRGDLKIDVQKKHLVLDSLFEDYKKIASQIRISKGNEKDILKNSLDSLQLFYDAKFTVNNDTILQQLNTYHYFEKLQLINPLDSRIDSFLQNISNPIAGRTLSTLLFFYVKNRVDTFDFNTLNTKDYTTDYIELLSIGMFNFLRHEDQKGDKKYIKAIDWLKTTSLYKNDSVYVRKEITPLDNKKFQEQLKKLQLVGTDFESTNFDTVLDRNPSEYYLIDFWATWCAPCIEGANMMNEMDFPANIEVISLSIDKANVKEKWKLKTKELGQKISYLLDEKDENNKEFLTFIELQSVPRYILIDKHANLIDEAFFHPQELQFLPKLKDIKYATYW